VPRESVEQKASRIATTEGAIQVIRASYKGCEAVVIGNSDSYVVRIMPGLQHCTCQARVNPCAHILAVQKIWQKADEGLIEWIAKQTQGMGKHLAKAL